MIGSVLVANRGEIAVRILRTCRRLGVRGVAVYSDADAQAPHVRLADTAVRIGPPPAAESYLHAPAILAAARATGAEAIHPGYGFLAENADFAQSCLDAGLVWIGPSPNAMRAVGDKAGAKALAERAGVPALPGYHGADQSMAVLRQHAQRIGAPLLIKASAGGGGRGMRLVEELAEFDAALEAAQREARAAFGDGRVLLERYVRRPRHVEIQILGDQYGNLVYLGERDCSVQRRHQKLLEESPSPAVEAATRQAMGEAALRLARAAGYSSAGTVEFLLEPGGRFALLEVNARLQVEHPVTEAVAGLDLVEWQLRIAAGERLPLAQADVHLDGHAIEARLIAEDPLAGWAPATGTVRAVQFPPPPVRTDTWIEPGTRVTAYYDSLLAKIVASGPDRQASLVSLAGALCQTDVDGVGSNLDLLLAVIQHPAFVAGDVDTGFLEHHAVLASLAEPPPAVLAAACALDVLRPAPRDLPAVVDPWQTRSAWRIGRLEQPIVWRYAERRHTAHLRQDLLGGGLEVRIGSHRLHVRLLGADGERYRLSVSARPPAPEPGEPVPSATAGPIAGAANGEVVHVWDVQGGGGGDGGRLRVVEWRGRVYRLLRAAALGVDDAAGAVRGSSAAAGELSAPMPGRVASVAIEVGDTVAQHQPLVVIEAMKMEHVIAAPYAGSVRRVHVQPGEQVAAGTLLVSLGSPAGSSDPASSTPAAPVPPEQAE